MNIAYLILSRSRPRTGAADNILSTVISNLWLKIYIYALRSSEQFHPDVIKALQQQRLFTIIKKARNFVPFYAKYLADVQNLADFEKLPPLTKHDIRKAFECGDMLNHSLEKYRVERFTSGSSGIPFVFYQDKHSYVKRAAIYQRMLRWVGYNGAKSETAVWIMRGSIHSNAGAIQFNASGPEELEVKRHDLYSILEGKTSVIHAMASHLVCLANLLEKDQRKFSIKGIISYGETLYPNVRSYLERSFGCPVFNYYASQEIMNIGSECEAHDGVHICSEWAYLEIVDEKNKPLPPGEVGEVVVTSFDNEVMPFIRYRLGDLGYWMKDPCPCGRTLPRIKLVGRSVNHFIVLPNGDIGDFITLASPILRQIKEISAFQIVRCSQHEYKVLLQPTEHFLPVVLEKIRVHMTSYLGNEITLHLNLVNKIPLSAGGKPEVFINLHNDLDNFLRKKNKDAEIVTKN